MSWGTIGTPAYFYNSFPRYLPPLLLPKPVIFRKSSTKKGLVKVHLTKQDKECLIALLRYHFGHNRVTSINEIRDEIRKANATLAAKLKKASKHLGFKAYLTKYFLKNFINEGWLTVTNECIQVNLSPTRCSFCFAAIEDVYLIDIDLNRYCGWNCAEKSPYYCKPYESNLDMYSSLFERFSEWLPLCRQLTANILNASTSEGAKELLSEIGRYLDDVYWDDFLPPHENRSCIDSEIYRMLTTLRKQADNLQKLIHDIEDTANSSNLCVQCAKPVDERYVVNQRGQYFCSEECHEIYHELYADEFKEMDDDHPYYFDYSSIRQEFIYWTEWKSLLQKKAESCCYLNAHAQWNADDFIDELDDIIWEYRDYIQTDGDDGIFAREIYNYTLKLRHIQQQLLKWRPERAIYYGLYFYDCEPNITEKLLEEIRAAESDEVVQTLDQHSHPFHEHFDYIFKTAQERDSIFSLLSPYFESKGFHLRTYSAHLCDGGCGDYLDLSDSLYWQNGWFYCESCLDNYDVGELSLDGLKRLLRYFEENNEKLQRIIYDESGDYDRFKSMIRRACRIHQIEFPVWVEK
ncbi:hypothetical protein [Thermicanus aegyptius]|uniref:hypothetical protein n=1 Tax=Thermicanus aegyptius TaxID=94009 RepID=UPI0004272FA7|nr:hypothetical protein [Thermicanus aegyptius]